MAVMQQSTAPGRSRWRSSSPTMLLGLGEIVAEWSSISSISPLKMWRFNNFNIFKLKYVQLKFKAVQSIFTGSRYLSLQFSWGISSIQSKWYPVKVASFWYIVLQGDSGDTVGFGSSNFGQRHFSTAQNLPKLISKLEIWRPSSRLDKIWDWGHKS